jgi:hypothetical protein
MLTAPHHFRHGIHRTFVLHSRHVLDAFICISRTLGLCTHACTVATRVLRQIAADVRLGVLTCGWVC